MKVGILTFHCAHNYGAVLQCYALQRTLMEMGHDVEIIDYRPDYLTRPYQVFNQRKVIRKNPFKMIKNLILLFLTWHRRVARYRSFESFMLKNLRLSVWKGKTSEGFPSGYDAYVIGSDQVWNPKISQGFEPLYFAHFPFEKFEKKYISYAASMGVKEFTTPDSVDFVKSALSGFDAISVRERSLAILLKQLVQKKIHIVLDPTLLASTSIWNDIAILPPKSNKKLVVIYQVRRNNNVLRIAKHIANQINGEVAELVSIEFPLSPFKNLFSVSPAEFVGFMKQADYIITTSFHGTAFSIIFQKPFYCIRLNDGRDGRSESLLTSLGLSERMINVDETPSATQVDYTIVNNQLNYQRKESIDYLFQSLQ